MAAGKTCRHLANKVHFTCTIPECVVAANKQIRIVTKVVWEIGNCKWASEILTCPLKKRITADDLDVDSIDEGGWAGSKH